MLSKLNIRRYNGQLICNPILSRMTKSENEAPHIALFPAAGMGHLIPFLRLAAALESHGCATTIITAEPPVSTAESDHLSSFFAIHPHIKRLPLKLVPYEKSGLENDDPFFMQMERIANSAHLLQPLLSSLSQPLSAVVVDLPILSRLSDLPIPMYTLITTSARFFSLMNHISHLETHNNAQLGHVEIPFLGSIPLSSIPPPLLDVNTFFAAMTTTNMASVPKLRGVLINTFTWLESRAVDSLGRNGVEHILPIGPLQPFRTGESLQLPWLDKQAPRTVLYISFGSRTAMSRDQIREVAAALEMSGCLFLWVLKGSKVDKEDNEEIEEMVGAAFLERTKVKGVIYKRWVEQDQILAHPAVGGFVSHCGWNSVTEAAAAGVPVLAWPMHGDQGVNAEVVEEMGLGMWDRDWSWSGHRLIMRDEIAEKLTALMGDERLRATAKEVREKALQARGIQGSSETSLQGLIHSLKSK